MVSIVGVRFQNAGKLYFFDPNGNWPTPGDYVVVDTSRGLEIGEAVTVVHEVPEDGLTLPLRAVLRVATAQDLEQDRANRVAAKDAHTICLRKIEEHQLDMKLVETQFTLDNTKLIFYFTANGRVDFRSLVKDLASVFHLRIELRQIGARDEAKMLGGLGPCGRPICCGAFLGDFQPVSIRMAKDQGLSLNPTKISGICGRLMCCLKYEQEGYERTRHLMPRIGKPVETPDGTGVVIDLNIMRERVTVRLNKGEDFENREYTLEDLRQLNPALRQRQEEAAAVTVEATPAAESQETRPPRAPRAESRKAQQPPRATLPQRAKEPGGEAEAVPDPAQRKAVKSAAPQTTDRPVSTSWRDALDKALKAASPRDGNAE